MRKYLVIGNPIEHSLSPKLHNYWLEKNSIDAIFEKKKVEQEEIKSLISKIKKEEIYGINVTVPFKKAVIPFMDELTTEANETQSVNTIYLLEDKVIGHNTDISGFELGIKYSKYNVKNKTVFILGAGGVVPSIIVALKRMGAHKIILSNRTKEKAKKLKLFFKDIEILDWGILPKVNMIINATSIGLNKNDKLEVDLKKFGSNNFFFDIIYNPQETDFLKKAKQLGNKTENGKMMFIYQAHQAFTIWHKIMPNIDEETINLLKE